MMDALTLGLVAALCWGLHDFTIRCVSHKVPLLSALMVVVIAGLVFQIGVLGLGGTFDLPQGAALYHAMASGVAFLWASITLYYAYHRGPVRLVSPIIGAYPIISLIFAYAAGGVITWGQIFAVGVIVAGVGTVAAKSDHGTESYPAAGPTIVLSALSAMGFASTFHFGQTAAALSDDLNAVFVARVTATLLLALILVIFQRQLVHDRRAVFWLLVMGLLDGIALLSVVSAGRYANPQLASVSSSIFGLLTILLAWAFLKERLSPLQWSGATAVFAAIGFLSL